MPNITVNDDLTVHVVSDDGDKEFFLGSYNPKTQKKFVSIEDATDCALRFAGMPNIWQDFISAEERAEQKDNLKATENREIRNRLLSESDWTQMNDSPLANEAKTAWATYRQALRDLSGLAAWPNLTDADWPVAP